MNGKTTGSSTRTQLVDIERVAERLGVKVRHVRLLRFDPAEIEAWIDGSRRPPAS